MKYSRCNEEKELVRGDDVDNVKMHMKEIEKNVIK